MAGCDTTDKVKALLRSMARAKIEEGHTDPDTILSHIHEAVKDHTPLERSEIADILVGHGGEKATRTDLQNRVQAFYKELRDRQVGGEEGKKAAALEASIKKLDEQIAKREPPTLPKQGPDSEEIAALRAERKDKAAQLAEIRKPMRPVNTVDTNVMKNAARQTVIRKSIADLEARIAAGDFRKAPPRQTYLQTTATEKAQARLNKLREDFEAGQRKAELANRGTTEKVADMIVELHRAAVLSSPNVLLKLPATAVSNIALRPLALEPIGHALKYLPGLRGIAAKAASEGGAGGYFGTEGNALKETATRSVAAMKQKATTGTHDLESLYGTKKEGDFVSDFKVTQMLGNIHGALKVPALINQWARSVQHRMASEANGLRRAKVPEDQIAEHLADPAVKARVAAEAYADAEREIFQNKNFFSEAYSALLGRVHAHAEKGGLGSTSAAIGEKALRFLLPITKVPTNIAIAGSSYAGGLFGALAQIGAATRAGMKNMREGKGVEGGIWKNAVEAITPEQADSVMRNLKRQGVGIAAMTLGAFLYKNLGGMWMPGDNKNPAKPEAETIDTRNRSLNLPPVINQGKVTKQVLEHPVMTAMMLGATAAWIAHKPGHGWAEGLYEGALATQEKNPFLKPIVEKLEGKPSGPGGLKGLEKFAGEQVSSMNPQLIQWAARRLDRTYEGKEIKRTPKTFSDEILQGIPGARKYVPRSQNQ
jgi:hypothetical protein